MLPYDRVEHYVPHAAKRELEPQRQAFQGT